MNCSVTIFENYSMWGNVISWKLLLICQYNSQISMYRNYDLIVFEQIQHAFILRTHICFYIYVYYYITQSLWVFLAIKYREWYYTYRNHKLLEQGWYHLVGVWSFRKDSRCGTSDGLLFFSLLIGGFVAWWFYFFLRSHVPESMSTVFFFIKYIYATWWRSGRAVRGLNPGPGSVNIICLLRCSSKTIIEKWNIHIKCTKLKKIKKVALKIVNFYGPKK